MSTRWSASPKSRTNATGSDELITSARGSSTRLTCNSSSIPRIRAVPARVAADTCPGVRLPNTSSMAYCSSRLRMPAFSAHGAGASTEGAGSPNSS
ncbi:MAG TPA: hypothetical protein VJT31_31350 [Rugosimonospora sp.]|nr:hypothetical protein [Rugosimonospora sp.]